MSELAKALLAFQKNTPNLHRDATNPHYGSKFLSLEGLMGKVLPVANEHGLVITQAPTTFLMEGVPTPALRTRIIHADSGESIEDVMLLMPGKQDPQAQGSAITYARRYSLMAALGLVADEDDDGNGARGSGAGDMGGSSRTTPAPGDFDEELYLQRVEYARRPGAKPSEQVVHFGKHKGKLLMELTPAQVGWLANTWTLQDTPSEYDHRLKLAAVTLHSGDDGPDFDVPFS